jgi:uncharacterized protein YegL
MDMNMNELASNPFTRVAVCMVLDSSGSMCGEKIEELNRGIEAFYNSVMSCEESKYSVDLSIVSFGNGGVKKMLDFDMVTNQAMPRLSADNMTPMGEGINTALDMLEERKSQYKLNGNDYYQPWMVLMTDGYATDDISYAVKRARNLVLENKLTVFPIAIGDAEVSAIENFSPKRKPMRLKGLNFVEFFQWLSKSVIELSRSASEEDVKLSIVGLDDWAKL